MNNHGQNKLPFTNRNLRLKPAAQAQSSSAILRSVLKEVLASTVCAASAAMANGWRGKKMKKIVMMVMSVAATATALAANRVFTGAVSGNWSDARNWQDSKMVQVGDYVIDISSRADSTVDFVMGLAISGYEYKGSYNGYRLKGKELMLMPGAPFINNGMRMYQNCPLVLEVGPHAFNLNKRLDNHAVISGDGGIVLEGASTLVLSSEENAVAGGVDVVGGTLAWTVPQTIPMLSVTNGATLAFGVTDGEPVPLTVGTNLVLSGVALAPVDFAAAAVLPANYADIIVATNGATLKGVPIVDSRYQVRIFDNRLQMRERLDFIVTLGDHPHLAAAWTSGDGSVTNAVDGASFPVPEGTTNVRVIFTAESGWEIVGDAVVDLGTVASDIVFGGESGYEVPTVRRAAVKYIDADGVEKTKSDGEFDIVTAETRELTSGWYAVMDNVVFPTNANLAVQGDVHLILCDEATLAITNKSTVAAVSVGTNATLTIYGQTQHTGRLEAKNGNSAAGIGGDKSGTCGTIAIHGGTVRAEGGTFSAGIGGGMLGNGGKVTITGGRIVAVGHNNAADIGSGYGATTPCAVSISGGIFARPVQDAWLAPGFAAVTNTDVATMAEYPWAIEDRRVGVSPNNPLGPYATAAEATNAMARAVFAPDVEVADVLTTQAARARYAGWFGLDVAERGASGWYVEAVLTDAAKSNLAETAAAATRQIPVATIAEMDENSMTNVTLVGCEPGFYYTLYGGPELADLSTTGTKYWSELCDADGTFAIPVVAKPSEAAGFFTIGVDAERPDNAGVAIVGTSVKSGKTVPGVRKVDFGGADGSSVSVWLENVKPKLAYGLGRSDVPQGPFVVEDGSWVMADEDGVLHKALTAPKVGPRNFYMIIVQ